MKTMGKIQMLKKSQRWIFGKMDKYQKVEVEWVDAQSGFGVAQPIEELINIKLTTTYSTGYLLHENKERIILGFMLFGEDMVKHDQIIPKGMIKKITKLIEVK